MKEYKVTFKAKEEVTLIVQAEAEKEAIRRATRAWKENVPEISKIVREG